MSTKIFVHLPLKRAELRRLTEPPLPLPEPIRIAPIGPDLAEKARRAAERAAVRAERERRMSLLKEEVELIYDSFKTIWITGLDFCRWLGNEIEKEKDLAADLCAERTRSIIVDMFAPHSSKICMYCGNLAFREPGHGHAALMVPVKFEMNPGDVFSYLLCDSCGKLPRRVVAYKAAALIVKRVWYNEVAADDFVKKVGITAFDLQYMADRLDHLFQTRKEMLEVMKIISDISIYKVEVR